MRPHWFVHGWGAARRRATCERAPGRSVRDKCQQERDDERLGRIECIEYDELINDVHHSPKG